MDEWRSGLKLSLPLVHSSTRPLLHSSPQCASPVGVDSSGQDPDLRSWWKGNPRLSRRRRVMERSQFFCRLGVFGLLALALACGGTAAAHARDGDTQATLTIGGVWCFIVRCPDGALTPGERVDQVQ